MRRAQVVIGTNYGDEGKGLMTDYFASQNPQSSVVVRFNGGAQAGHTVVAPDGRRHIFSHFGSGSFLECPTYLSRFFIVNPMLFLKELRELQSKGINPTIYMDRHAIVSTPFDVFINQFIETRRAATRHGSCGVGINETVTRCLRSSKLRTEVKDLLDPDKLADHLVEICKKWLPERLRELKIEEAGQDKDVLAFLEKADAIIQRYLEDVEAMLDKALVTAACPAYQQVIFEGAQGLLLDEARIDLFPHLTRSRTGLTNVVELSKEMRIEELDVNYVSRTYLTKHGAGPLPGEDNWAFPDRTNIPNPFQGKLRFAHLDLEQLAYSINLDLTQAKHKHARINASLSFTCADQLPLPDEKYLPLPVTYISEGPCRADIKKLIHCYSVRKSA